MFRLTKLCIEIDNGSQDSTNIKKTCPYLVLQRMCIPLGNIFIELTQSNVVS